MSKTVFPTINWITLSGEVVSAPITRATRGGPKLTTFIIGVSSGSARPARIAVAAPAEMSAELSEALKVGVEVVVEGQLIPAPVRTGRGLTPLRISATRIQALGSDGRSQEIRMSVSATSVETVAKTPLKTAEKPKRPETRARSEGGRKPRRSSAISIRATKGSALSASKVSGASEVPEAPAAEAVSESSVAKLKPAVSQHGRQRRRRQPGSEVIQTGISSAEHELAAPSKSPSKAASTGALKRKPKAKRSGRSTKTPSGRPQKPSAPWPPSSSRTKAPKKSPAPKVKPKVKTRPAAKSQRRAVKPSKPTGASRKTPKPEPASDSPFTLTQSESSFDPFLVDDKD